MENKEEILKKLYSNDSFLQKEAYNEIKSKGDISIIPSLLDYMETHEDRMDVINILSDIKEDAFKKMLIERIQSNISTTVKRDMLRICWESSLDFSEYANIFADILLESELTAALEASTVLENLSTLSSEVKTRIKEQFVNKKHNTENHFLISVLIQDWE